MSQENFFREIKLKQLREVILTKQDMEAKTSLLSSPQPAMTLEVSNSVVGFLNFLIASINDGFVIVLIFSAALFRIGSVFYTCKTIPVQCLTMH